MDPGLDACGWALWKRPTRFGLTLQSARSLCVASGAITTKPVESDSTRLFAIGSSLRALLRMHQPAVVVCEVPAIEGTYRRNRVGATTQDGFMPGTMKHVHRVVGVVCYVGEAEGCTVLLHRAQGKKETAHLALRLAWPDLGRTNEDQRDAILLGYRALDKVRV